LIEWWDRVDLEEDDNSHDCGFLDTILEDAEEKRRQFIDSFSDFMFTEQPPVAMAVEDKAYWEWTCVLTNSSNQLLTLSLVFEFHERFKSVYTIEITVNTNKIFSIAGIVTPADLPVAAFNDIYKLIAYIICTDTGESVYGNGS
jgi:hypothetical protein